MSKAHRSPTKEVVARKILILFAHPSLERSEVNAPMLEAAKKLDNVTCVDLYAEYPDFQIRINREQKRLLEHDIIIFQHPLYWYSTPAILKEWQDLVLEHGFAYGRDGTKLQGKIFFNAISAGGTEDAYRPTGSNNFSIRELLKPFEQMANLCGMLFLPAYTLFGSRTAIEEHRVKQHINNWIELLKALSEDRVNLTLATGLRRLDCDLDAIIQRKAR